jgi:outer membrane protein insertion porin family
MKKESNYRTNQVGFGLRLGFALDDYQHLYTRYRLTYRDTKKRGSVDLCTPDVPPGTNPNYSPSICDSLGKDLISSLGATYVFDNLDSPIDPTSGFRGQVAVDFAGAGGDVHYVKTEAAGYYFYPLPVMEGLVFKLKGTGGYIQGWNGDKVKINDRFFKGGPSFRGFEVSGVGPRDAADNYLGGKAYAIGTAEVMFPIWGLPESLGLSGSIFTDVGTVFDAPGAPHGDKPKLRASAGAGLIWKSPFGPLRLDVAYAFKKAKYDKDELIQFGVGTKF